MNNAQTLNRSALFCAYHQNVIATLKGPIHNRLEKYSLWLWFISEISHSTLLFGSKNKKDQLHFLLTLPEVPCINNEMKVKIRQEVIIDQSNLCFKWQVYRIAII